MDMQAFGVPKEDALPFVKCMAAVARADGQVVDEERQAIESAMMAWGIEGEDAASVQDVLAEGGDVSVFVQQFTLARTAYLLVQELITLAKIDGEYDDTERSAVREIATACCISDDRVCALEQWVDEGMAWRQRGLQLLEPEE